MSDTASVISRLQALGASSDVILMTLGYLEEAETELRSEIDLLLIAGTERRRRASLRRQGQRTISFPANLVPSCRPCNSSKGDKLLSEWKGRRGYHC